VFTPPVFKAEREAGLEQLIRSNASIAYLAQVGSTEPFEVSDKAMAQLVRTLAKSKASAAGQNDLVLHYLKTILVSTGWNKNDDVFDLLETWGARHSPEDTPFNYEHQSDQIIGHITGNYVIDVNGNVIADDSTIDDLPAKFHIVTSAVLYKIWDKPELQDRMDKILAEIEEGKWFVSMECYFRGFDYAMLGKDGQAKIVARNEQTAFLTKHLRAYGGTGQYGEFKVGRLLRNIVFSGKGLVAKPANPESIIFAEASEEFRPAQANIEEIFSHSKSLGYETMPQQQEQKTNMTVEVNELQKQLEAALAKIATLEAQARDNDVKKIQATLESTEAIAVSLKTRVEELSKALETETAEAAKFKVELDTVKTALSAKEEEAKTLASKLEAIEVEKKTIERLNKLKSALKVNPEDADALKSVETLNESLAALSDEAFEKFIETQAKFTPAPLAPKQTPAPLAPKATNKPAPMGGKASEDEGAENADATALENVTPENSADLSAVASEEDSVTKLRQSIAGLFGAKDESAAQ